MAFWERAKHIAGIVARRAKRESTEAKLKLKANRLKSRIESEKEQIGKAVYPLLANGTLTVDLPEVHERLGIITRLQAELEGKRAVIDALDAEPPNK